MDDPAYVFLELQQRIRQVAERAGGHVIGWQQDPRDPRHFFINTRLWFLPANAPPVQLELFLPSLRTQL